MRITSLCLFAFSGAFMLASCNPGFEEGEKKNSAEISSGRQQVTHRLASSSEAAGDLAQAERMYLQEAKASGDSKESLIQLANFYNRHKQSARAVILLEALQQKNPEDMELLRMLANSHINAGTTEKALSLLNSGIENHVTDAYLHNSRGVALDRLGRFTEARESYRKAIALSPGEEMDFKTNLSMSYILNGEYNNAIELLTPLMGGRSTPEVRQNLALAYGLNGDMDTAMKIGSRDLSIKDMNDNIRFYQMLGKPAGAKTARASGKLAPSDVYPVMPPLFAPLTEAELPKEEPAIALPVETPVTQPPVEQAKVAAEEPAIAPVAEAEPQPAPVIKAEEKTPEAKTPLAVMAEPEVRQPEPAPVAKAEEKAPEATNPLAIVAKPELETKPQTEAKPETEAKAAAPAMPVPAGEEQAEPAPAINLDEQKKSEDKQASLSVKEPELIDLRPGAMAALAPAQSTQTSAPTASLLPVPKWPTGITNPAELNKLTPAAGMSPKEITAPLPAITPEVKQPPKPRIAAAKKPVTIEPSEEGEDDDTSSGETETPQLSSENLPTPVLKPESW